MMDGVLVDTFVLDGEVSTVLPVAPPVQSKIVTPSEDEQTILPDEGYLLNSVEVGAIPSTYKDTSDANIVPADVLAGKIGYGADGPVIGTNTYVPPVKGVIFDDWDNNGIPHFARYVGLTVIPNASMYRSYNTGITGDIHTLILDEGTKTIGIEAFFKQTTLASVTFPTTLTTINSDAFKWCTSLADVVIPNTQKLTIASGAFGSGGLSGTLTIAGDVQLADSCMSGDFSRLTQLVFGGNVEWGNPFGVFTTVISTITLYDFSHCTEVITLSNDYKLPHANGCVVRVPAALLHEWESAWSSIKDITLVGV